MPAPPDPHELVRKRLEHFVQRIDADAGALRRILASDNETSEDGLNEAFHIAYSLAEDAGGVASALRQAGFGG